MLILLIMKRSYAHRICWTFGRQWQALSLVNRKCSFYSTYIDNSASMFKRGEQERWTQ
jgi:hypothetical protein